MSHKMLLTDAKCTGSYCIVAMVRFFYISWLRSFFLGVQMKLCVSLFLRISLFFALSIAFSVTRSLSFSSVPFFSFIISASFIFLLSLSALSSLFNSFYFSNLSLRLLAYLPVLLPVPLPLPACLSSAVLQLHLKSLRIYTKIATKINENDLNC